MKAGRPAYHVRSKWVTVTTPQGILYFELDAKGNLLRKDLRPDRIVPLEMPPLENTAPVAVPATVLTPIPEMSDGDFDMSREDYWLDDPFDWV
jgi:hypothetical protein